MPAILTFENLRDQVLYYLDQAGETGNPKQVVDDTLRRVHTARLAERKWNFMLWDGTVSLSTVVGQKFYSLHQEFFRPYYFFNRSTKRTMEQVVPSTLIPTVSNAVDYDTGFGLTDWTDAEGSAYRYQIAGISQVQSQPSSASVLTVAGEAAKTVTVKGETTDGIATETITVGTPGSTEFTKILQVVKGDGWTQTMTLTSNGGAVTNLKLFASEYGRQYRQIELMNEPTSVEALIYRFYRRPSALDSDNSIPDIPAPFSEVLVYDALIQLATYNRNLDGGMKQLWQSEQFRLEQGLLEFDEGQDALDAAVEYQPYIPRD
jgi:hypothetical protein